MLIIKQVNGECASKKLALVSYRTSIQKLINSFMKIRFLSLTNTQQAYTALVTLAFKVDVPGNS